MKPSRFLVVFDDDAGLCCPYGWDTDCPGALCSLVTNFVLFDTRQAARNAIRISTCFAKLRQAQGKIANTDFIESLKYIKIIPCFDNLSPAVPAATQRPETI